MTRKHAVRAFWLGAACAVAALGLAVAAGAGGKATPQPKNGGTLVIGLAAWRSLREHRPVPTAEIT